MIFREETSRLGMLVVCLKKAKDQDPISKIITSYGTALLRHNKKYGFLFHTNPGRTNKCFTSSEGVHSNQRLFQKKHINGNRDGRKSTAWCSGPFFLTLVPGRAKGLVSFGCVTHETLLAFVVHAKPQHIINLRTVPESVGEYHGTDHGMVGAARNVSCR